MKYRQGLVTSSSGLGLALTLALLGGLATPAEAKVFYSQNEALELAFPEADRIERDAHILQPQQVAAVEKRARARLDSRIVTLYSGWRGEELLGYAYIDIHTVRTLPEAFMVVLDPDGQVRSLRVLAFHEPLDYMPTDRWYGQFENKTGAEPLRLGKDIHGIMGATLSARAASDSVRRVLAIYEILVRTEG
ncbi:MAG: FMN-binding protein [Proteobacteria bacterium]|nr:FMN-binding protein [Pseudomonadota bacterium]